MSGVAVTGLAVLSPAGVGVDALWDACAGAAVRFLPITHFDPSGTGSELAGFVPAPEGAPPPGDADRMRYLAGEAVRQALADTGEGPAARTALVLATTDNGACPNTAVWQATGGHGRRAATTDLTEVAAGLPVTGPVLVVGNASASGAAALAVGADLVRGGVADRVVVCGVDTVTEVAFYGLAALRALSPSGCHPFGLRRSGIRISECAAAMVLERPARGTRSYATFLGWGASNDVRHPARPEASAIATAVTRALADAGLPTEAIGYVNAHAAGTKQGDSAELAALEKVFGRALPRIPIASTKGAVAHCQGAAGTVEAIVTALTLDRGEVLPTVGLTEVDPAWSHLRLRHAASSAPGAALSISCGLGGAHVALVFGAAGGVA